MKRVITIVAAGLFGFCMQCSTAAASGPTISDKALNITLTLPDGFELISHVPSSSGHDIEYTYRRQTPDEKDVVAVSVQQLPGVIRRESTGEEFKKYGASKVYMEKWKSFDVEVVVMKMKQGSLSIVSRCVQVPIAPYAIQLNVAGLESQDAELADVTRALLGSLDGPSNWLTEDQRKEAFVLGFPKFLFWVIVTGAVVYKLAAWRTNCFRTRAVSMGLSVEVASQKIRPSWAWYLLPAYLFFASICVGSIMVLIDLRYKALWHKALWHSLGIDCLGFILASVITGIIMWHRVKAKRRILATLPPPLPTPPG